MSESTPTPHKQEFKILPLSEEWHPVQKNQNTFLYSLHLGAPLSILPYCESMEAFSMPLYVILLGSLT